MLVMEGGVQSCFRQTPGSRRRRGHSREGCGRSRNLPKSSMPVHLLARPRGDDCVGVLADDFGEVVELAGIGADA